MSGAHDWNASDPWAHPDDASDPCAARTQNLILMCSSVVGLIGGTFIVVTHFLLPPHQQSTPGRCTLFWMSVSDILLSATYLFEAALFWGRLATCPLAGVDIDAQVCVAIGAINEYSSLCCILWTTALSYNLHVAMDSPNGRLSSRSYWVRMHAISWGVPGVTVGLLGWMGALGSAGNSCWIRDDFQWARFTFYYFPVVVSLGVTIAIHWRMKWRLAALRNHCIALLERGHGAEEGDSEAGDQHRGETAVRSAASVTAFTANVRHSGAVASPRGATSLGVAHNVEDDITHRLSKLLVVFGAILAVQLINRIHDWVSSQPNDVLGAIENAVSPLQGFADAIVYAWSPYVQVAWKRKCV